MGKKGTVKILIYNGALFDRFAFPDYFLFLFKSKPDFEPGPVKLADGSIMSPGDKFKTIGGSKRSAGFTNIDMIGDAFLQYNGAISSIDGRALCFGDNKNPGGFKYKDYESCFWGWFDFGHGHNWFHSTPAVSGRIIETSRIARVVDAAT